GRRRVRRAARQRAPRGRARPRPHGRHFVMAEAAVAAGRRWKKPPFIRSARLRWALGLGIALYLAAAFGTTEVNWARVAEGIPRGVRFVAAFFPPDFVTRWDAIAEGIAESLWMTAISTVVGIALSIPIGL